MTRRVREMVLARPAPDGATAADFALVERPLPPRPDAGLVHVRPLWLAIDPYVPQAIRGRHMGAPAPAPGASLPGESVAVVLASGAPDFAPGDHVVGAVGWAEEAIVPAVALRKVDPALGEAEHLGLLGMPGLTAWAGMTLLADVKAGDIVCVDAAAGAVGGTAGQIARIEGAHVTGIAGGPDKARIVTGSYGFDACVDYHRPDWEDRLPDGIDVHFENVGQRVLDAIVPRLRSYGRIVLCGLAQHYADGSRAVLPVGPLIGKRAIVRGLIVYDFLPRLPEWLAYALPHFRDGRLVEAQDIAMGLDAAAGQCEKVANGQTRGRPLVDLRR